MKECWKTTTTVKNVGKHKKIFQQNDINVSLLLSSCKSLLREYKQPKDWNIKKKMLKEIMVSLLNDNKQKKQYEATYTTKTFINIIPWRVVTWTFWRKESFIHLKNVYYNITYINTNTCSKGIYMYLKKSNTHCCHHFKHHDEECSVHRHRGRLRHKKYSLR